MAKTVRRLLAILGILTISTIIVLIVVTTNKTFYNDEDFIGNTQGNLHNGGLFSEIEGRIFFSNHKDDGSLYVMNSDSSNVKKVHNDKAVYINVDDEYIYYSRANNTRQNSSGSRLMFYNTGAYRINRNGKNLKSITTNPINYLTLCGNFLYYQNYDINNGLFLYGQKIDLSNERLLIKDAVVPIGVYNNELYYTGYSHDNNIHTLRLDSFTENVAYKGKYAYPIFQDDYIYYMDLSDKYAIARMDLDGSNKLTIVDERCASYNITKSGRYLYYQVDNEADNRIARINLETMEEEVILEGNYKQIHVTDKYVFFKDFNEDNTYVVSADGKIELSTFEPAVDID